MTRRTEAGAVLVTCLVLVSAVMLAALAAAGLAGQGLRLVRAEHDRASATQAAEAALQDAQEDLELALQGTAAAYPERAAMHTYPATCGGGSKHPLQGLCLAGNPTTARWMAVDLADEADDSAVTVAYGRFTGRRLPGLARLPRYLVEAVPLGLPGMAADTGHQQWVLRITAAGFGAQAGPLTVLQAHYRPVPP